jgi:hypothetical protein
MKTFEVLFAHVQEELPWLAYKSYDEFAMDAIRLRLEALLQVSARIRQESATFAQDPR